MLKIEYTTQFRRDYKRELKSRNKTALKTTFVDILNALANNQPLSKKYRDHALTGNWKDHRDCHIKPDLILIYRKVGDETLQLVRLGSHSELSL